MLARVVQHGIAWGGLFLGMFLLVGGAITGWIMIPTAVTNKLKEEMKIEKGNDIYKEWANTTMPVYMKVWVFNYTNPKAIQKGERAQIQELGPYAFRERKEKIEIEVSKDGSTVSYKEKTTWFFDPKLSAGSLDDIVNTPDMPLIALAHSAKAMDLDMASLFIEWLVDDKEEPSRLIKKGVKVGDMLFAGWELPKPYHMVPEEQIPDEMKDFRFGYFKMLNGTPSKDFVVRTGQHGDSLRVGQIKSYDGRKILNWWNFPADSPRSKQQQCNKINGTDGSIFGPLVTKDTILSTFSPRGCRSIALVFDQEVIYNKVPGYRFAPYEQYLADPGIYPEVGCFCPQQHKKLAHYCGAGFMRMWPCSNGAPLVTSNPHFYKGTDDLFRPVDITPGDKESHESHFILEPTAGIPLSGHSRAQINIEVQPIEGFKLFEDLDFSAITDRKSIILPLFWIDEGTDAPDDFTNGIYEKIVKPKKALDAFRWVPPVLGFGLTVASSVFLGRLLRL